MISAREFAKRTLLHTDSPQSFDSLLETYNEALQDRLFTAKREKNVDFIITTRVCHGSDKSLVRWSVYDGTFEAVLSVCLWRRLSKVSESDLLFSVFEHVIATFFAYLSTHTDEDDDDFVAVRDYFIKDFRGVYDNDLYTRVYVYNTFTGKYGEVVASNKRNYLVQIRGEILMWPKEDVRNVKLF